MTLVAAVVALSSALVGAVAGLLISCQHHDQTHSLYTSPVFSPSAILGVCVSLSLAECFAYLVGSLAA